MNTCCVVSICLALIALGLLALIYRRLGRLIDRPIEVSTTVDLDGHEIATHLADAINKKFSRISSALDPQ